LIDYCGVDLGVSDKIFNKYFRLASTEGQSKIMPLETAVQKYVACMRMEEAMSAIMQDMGWKPQFLEGWDGWENLHRKKSCYCVALIQTDTFLENSRERLGVLSFSIDVGYLLLRIMGFARNVLKPSFCKLSSK